MTPMSIGLVMDDFFPASGGVGRSVQTQMEELVALGHEVTLIAPDRYLQKPGVGRVIESPTIHIEGLPAHLSILRSNEGRARSVSERARFDVVHSHTERGAIVLSARIARLQRIPHLHTFHANIAGTHQTVRSAVFGTLLYQLLINPVLTKASRKSPPPSRLPGPNLEPGGLAARMDWASFADLAGKVDAYTVPAPFMRDLINHAANRELPGHVVATGVNQGMIDAIARVHRRRTDSRVRFVAVGRLAKEKRVETLVKAFLRAGLPDAELVLVGDGDQRRRIERLAHGSENIHLRGHLGSREDLAQELVDADVLALASYRFDSQALVLAEGAAAGLPVLYCDERLQVGTSPESALLTGPSEAELAAGMRALMDPARRKAMSEASKKLLSGLAPGHTGQAYEEIYRGLVTHNAA